MGGNPNDITFHAVHNFRDIVLITMYASNKLHVQCTMYIVHLRFAVCTVSENVFKAGKISKKLTSNLMVSRELTAASQPAQGPRHAANSQPTKHR
jgi:hypothetical protein